MWLLPAVSRLESHPISCAHAHTNTHSHAGGESKGEGARKRDVERHTHNEGTPSAGSRVTLQLSAASKKCINPTWDLSFDFLTRRGTIFFFQSLFFFFKGYYFFYFLFLPGVGGPNWREGSMEYFMVPAQKVPSLQHFRKTEKEVIGGLCRCVHVRFKLFIFFGSART